MKKRILPLLLMFALAILAFPAASSARDELKNTDPDKYYILLDLNNQFVTVYERDDAGEYTRIVRRFICTTGRTKLDPEDPEDVGTPTPRGIWKIGGRERFGKFASFAGEYARYWTQIVGGNYFHSIMFGRRNINALKGSPYGSLGNNISHGCVRLYVEDAKWLYYYACPGTVVNVSTTEKKQPEIKSKLKYSIPFSTYNAMQKKFYDEEELPNYTAWTVTDDADMRTGNGSNDRRIKVLKKNTPVEILQVGDPWCKVLHGGKEGYIRTAYLTFVQGTTQSIPEADIIRGTVYMLKAPERGAAVMFKVPTYTSVKILDNSLQNYAYVHVWGKEGYIAKSAIIKGWGLDREQDFFW